MTETDIAVCEVSTIEELTGILRLLTQKDIRRAWIFRGQNDATWGLQTTLERSAEEMDRKKLEEIINVEMRIIDEFKKKAHFYNIVKPSNDSPLEWSCIIQHFGGPTRMLDCTTSIYVAAYFAIDGSKSDFAAIWCFNETYLLNNQVTSDKPYKSIRELRAKIDENPNGTNCAIQEYVSAIMQNYNKMETAGILPVKPDYMTDRISIQQGLFLTAINMANNFPEKYIFENNLCVALGIDIERWRNIKKQTSGTESFTYFIKHPSILKKCGLVKLIIPKSKHKELAKSFDDMNITSATLFPGLEGFTRSLKLHFLYE